MIIEFLLSNKIALLEEIYCLKNHNLANANINYILSKTALIILIELNKKKSSKKIKFMRFSERIGKTSSAKLLQLESMDEDLRIGLWNTIKISFLDDFEKQSYGQETYYQGFAKIIWTKFFKLPIDKLPTNNFRTEEIIRDKFFKYEWFEVYDFLEFLANLDDGTYRTRNLIESSNNILEEEFSGYRFIGNLICPISNTLEIEEIEEALSQNISFTSLNGANIHLNNALEKLSDKKNPDYRNSIKESISALETTCRILTDESTLGKALNALNSKGIEIDEQLKSGYEKIYAFTNNKQSGIRHAIVDEHKTPDFDDAKYILLLSSSMINYLIGKCRSQGISII